jgi:modification methylase
MAGRLSISIRQADERKFLATVCNVDLVLTSPPYNIGSKAAKCLGDRRNGICDRKSWGAITGYADSLPEQHYQEWQHDFLERCASALRPGGVIAYNHKERHVRGELLRPETWFPDSLELFDRVIWNRGSTHNHCKAYAYLQHEFVYLLRRRGDHHFYSGAGLASVLTIPPDIYNPHNAPMPLLLPRLIIRKFSPADGLVCDPFLGSGTTALAASLEGRKFVGCERLRKYYRLACKRLESA